MTIDDTWYQRPEGIPSEVAAGGVVVRRTSDQILVALIREGTLPSFALPKGHLEAGETALEAARREIEEEAGFTQLRHLGDLGVLERLDYRKKHWKITHYFLFATNEVEAVPTDSAMTHRVEWFPLEALPEIFWPEQRTLIETQAAAIRQRV